MVCTICGNDKLELMATEIRGAKANVLHCADCDVGLLEPKFNDAQSYYDNEYRQKFSDDLVKPSSDPQSFYDSHANYQGNRLQYVSSFFDASKTFLEIGCSAGQFLSHVIPKFKKCYGVEFDTKSAEYVRNNFGVEVKTSELGSADFSEEKFDYIAAFQVLEHTASPVEFLSQIRNKLNDKGRVFIEVPNLYDALRVCWNVPAYKPFYFHEAHTHYFSLKALERAFGKAGFKIESAFYTQDYNFLNHLFWYFTNKPQGNCHFGLSVPKIEFADQAKEAGEVINRLIENADKEYKKILADHGLSSNIFLIASVE